jgi:hypothetical protein
MEKSTLSWKRCLLPMIAGIALTTVALSPKTAWIVRPELTAAMGVWPQSEIRMLEYNGLSGDKMPLADLRNSDFESQPILDNIDNGTGSRGEKEKDRESPETLATLLRFGVAGNASLRDHPVYVGMMPAFEREMRSPEEIWAEAEEAVYKAQDFLRSAEKGEQRDPNNAFFPWMKSIGLFALQRDEEAITALHRAAQCATFDDYSDIEARAQLARLYESLGKVKAVTQFTHLKTLAYPHYTALHTHARLVMGLAVRKEQSGDKTGGMVLRRDLASLSQTLQRGAHNDVGKLLGIVCEQTAYQYPAGLELPSPQRAVNIGEMPAGYGAPAADNTTSNTASTMTVSDLASTETEKEVLRKARQWRAYALAQGAPELADRPALLYHKAKWTERLQSAASERLTSSLETSATHDLLAASALTMSVFLLLLGGIFWGFSKFTRIREGKPAHRMVAWGAVLNATYPMIGYPRVLLSENTGIALYAAGTISGTLLGIALTRLVSAEGSWVRRIGLFITTLLVPIGILALLAWLLAPSMAIPLTYLRMTQGLELYYYGCADWGKPAHILSDPQVLLVMPQLALISPKVFLFSLIWLIPVLLLLGLTIASCVRRVPVTVGITRGFVRWALPIASLLILAFALTAFYRTRAHDQVRDEIHQMTQQEGTILSTNQTVPAYESPSGMGGGMGGAPSA